MNRPLLLLALAAFAVAPAFAQNADQAPAPTAESITVPLNLSAPEQGGGDAIHENGPLINCVGCGVGGADESILESLTLGTSTFGYGAQNAAGNLVADDFTVPEGETWEIDNLIVYSYQTGSGPPSTIDGVFVEIYDGDPADGGTVVFGDQSTNLLASTEWANAYRVTEETTGGNADRPIMEVVADIGISLTEGTYWVVYSLTGTGGSGPWVPPVPTMGECYEGNAQQFTTNGWNPLINGNPDTGVGCLDPFGVEMPFLLIGTVTGTAVEGGPQGGVFSLAPARPNPTGDVSRFELTVATTQQVRAEVLDALGRRVAVLFEGLATAGAPTTLTLDARSLPAGVYVVMVTGEQHAATHRVTVAR